MNVRGTRPLRCVAGSPNRFHDRRTSMSLVAFFAAAIASPSVGYAPVKSRRNSSRSMAAWLAEDVSEDEAHTAMAPPFGARTRLSARLSAGKSVVKNPLRQVIAVTNGRRPPLVRPAESSPVNTSSCQTSTDPWPK